MRRIIALVPVFALLHGCATYTTPGAGVNVGDLSRADEDIAEVMKREPAAPFPVRLAIARAQASGYQSRNNACFGQGAYCVVTTRDIETEADFERLQGLPMIAGVAPLGRILVPERLDSIKDLRLSAAQLKADLLLVYSLDTRFNVETKDIGPFSLISLGFLPNKKAHVTTTASSALFDVRTGFVYGIAEGTATEQQAASMWSTEDAIDQARLRAEAASFQKLLAEFEKLWKNVVETHARTTAATAAP